MGIITCKAASASEPIKSRPLEKRPRTPPILDDYAEHFPSALSPSHIFKVKKELRANLQDDERLLLEHCLALIRTESEKNGEEQWNDAMVTVLCSERQIVLSSGTKKNKYEVWMESGNPRYKVTDRDNPVKPKIPEDFMKHISPPIKPSSIQQVQKDLQEMLNDDERQLLQYCMTLVTDETKTKKGEKQWDDVTIIIIFSRGWRVVISTKSDYITKNEYEVWMEGITPKFKMTKQERAVTPGNYYKYISPLMEPSIIQDVKNDLQKTLNDDENMLLEYCMTMIAEEAKITGETQWKDVTITIICKRKWKIVIATGSSTTNAYQIWMDGKTPKHKMTGRGLTEKFWSGYSQLPSVVDTASSISKALPSFRL